MRQLPRQGRQGQRRHGQDVQIGTVRPGPDLREVRGRERCRCPEGHQRRQGQDAGLAPSFRKRRSPAYSATWSLAANPKARRSSPCRKSAAVVLRSERAGADAPRVPGVALGSGWAPSSPPCWRLRRALFVSPAFQKDDEDWIDIGSAEGLRPARR